MDLNSQHRQRHQNHPNLQMHQQQQQKVQQISQHSSVVMQQMIQQRQLQSNAPRQQDHQQSPRLSATPSQLTSHHANVQQPQNQNKHQGMMRSGLVSQQGLPMRKTGTPALSNSNSPPPTVQPLDQPSGLSTSMQTSTNISSGVIKPTTRVVPISVSPNAIGSFQCGGVSEASLAYTKYALESIINSLNATNLRNNSKGLSDDGKVTQHYPATGRVYTIRDLSTCLGAWDLNIPTNSFNNKRAKIDGKASADFSDGNADTAFNFYHERSCPILLDAKRYNGIFSVEDFSEDSTATGLPVVVGAVVLTFGADSKFTGGIGEEGVLTKAIFEFFYDPIVVLGKNSKEDAGDDAISEAEDRVFSSIDGGSSALIKAALHALSPPDVEVDTPPLKDVSTSSSTDNGVYTPTIWSGNTDRIYQYCLLGNFDDEGKQRSSKRLCVAIEKRKANERGESRPAKGVCRITLTLSPASVLAKKQQMEAEKEKSGGYNSNALASSASAVHKKIRQSLRILRPPKLTTMPNRRRSAILAHAERSRHRLRRSSISKPIDPSLIIVGLRCKHELLLDSDEVGKVYLNGVLVADCSLPLINTTNEVLISSDRVLGTLGSDILPAHTLFGVDFTFESVDAGILSSTLPSRTVLEREYGKLLVDALIDAEQSDADFAGKLLNRLNFGKTEELDFDDFDDDNIKDGKDGEGSCEKKSSSPILSDTFDNKGPSNEGTSKINFDDVSRPSLESLVLSNSSTDPVGIGAKALGTKFLLQHGKESFPCEMGTDESDRLQKMLGSQKIAKPVPRRLRDILRRGGYLNLDQMAKFLWNTGGSSWNGSHDDAKHAAEAMEGAMQLLRKAGCNDVKPNQIRFVAREVLEPEIQTNDGHEENSMASNDFIPPASQLRCWYDSQSKTYFVSDAFMFCEPDVHKESKSFHQKVGGENSSSAPVKHEPNGEGLHSMANKKLSCEPISVLNENINTENTDGSAKIGNDREGNVADDMCHDDGAGSNSINANVLVGNVAVKEETIRKRYDLGNTAENSDEKDTADKQDIRTDSTALMNSSDLSAENMSIAKQVITSHVKKESKDEGVDINKGGIKYTTSENAAYILALYIAKEHPDSMMLERFVMSSK